MVETSTHSHINSDWELFNKCGYYSFDKLDGAFLLYAIIGIAGLIWGYFYIPETKGKSLEKIEDHWRKGKTPREL